MDNLSYKYKIRENDPTLTKDYPNQLLRVDDTVADNAVANADIDDQDGNNYAYNAIGQLIRNNTEDIDYFYNASCLVAQVDQGGQAAVKFFYNDRNHRIKKESYVDGNLNQTTYYVRDVAGQVMAIYSDAGGSMAVVERPIYGSGRIGVAYTGGNTLYELTDHLGNVRAVFSKDQGNAELEGYTDYYPFGMPMPQRNTLEGEAQYRYAFQGQEKDDETGKEAFELRLWDSRIGRWLTTDPYRQFASPYLGMGNNPINGIDPDGGMVIDPDQLYETGQYLNEAVSYFTTGDPFAHVPGIQRLDEVYLGSYAQWKEEFGMTATDREQQMLTRQRRLAAEAIDPSMPRKVLLGTLAVPLAVITGGEFLGLAATIGTYSTPALSYSTYSTVAAESTQVVSYQLFRVPSGQVINYLGKRYIGGQLLPISYSGTLLFGKGISEVYYTASYVGSMTSVIYHGSNLYRLGALTGGTGFVLWDLFNPANQADQRPYNPSNLNN